MNTGRHLGDHLVWHRWVTEALASFGTKGSGALSEPVASLESSGPPPLVGLHFLPGLGHTKGLASLGSQISGERAKHTPSSPRLDAVPLGIRPAGVRKRIPSPLGSTAPSMEKDLNFHL